jgi:hypothetical protein
MRAKSALAGGGRIHGDSRRQGLKLKEVNRAKISTLDSANNDRRSNDDKASDKNKVFNQSFYRINHNGGFFEKIPHKANGNDESVTDIISPYKDECSLDIEAVNSS